MELLGRRYDSGQPVRLKIDSQQIGQIIPVESPTGPGMSLPWIAPAWIDLQVNGYGGQEFSAADLTPEKVRRIALAMDAFGVGRFCPTVTTGGEEVIEHALRTIAAACQSSSEVGRRVAGIHLEGPYLSPEDGPRGAHRREYCRLPDFDQFRRWQDAAGGRIRILTMAVELDGAIEFIEQVADTGVVVAIGHSAPDSGRIRAAVDAGVRLSTHLGNGCHTVLPRHPNYLWDQLADDRLTASLIVDGHHLPPSVVKTFVRAKTPGRCLLISDLAGQAGLPPGRHAGNLSEVEILDDGRLVVAGQRELLAGASAPIGVGVANVMRMAQVSLSEAVAMAVDLPAKLLGIEPGRLEPGEPADLVLFDLEPEFRVRATLLDGQTVYGRVEEPET